MNHPFITPVPHQAEKPLSIEREMTAHGEVIIIEGVRYDSEYFRTFAAPETDVLYGVQRCEDFVKLTVISTVEEAKQFFEEVVEHEL